MLLRVLSKLSPFRLNSYLFNFLLHYYREFVIPMYVVKKTLWPDSARERRLSVMLMPTFEDRECHVISMTWLLGFLDQSCCLFFQVAPQLYSRGSTTSQKIW
jgi:hypothetical protein